jgi:hypothetical protein
VPTAKETKMTKINVPVAHKFSISPIPEAHPKALIKKIGQVDNRIIDNATISEKFTWNFDFETSATKNCSHRTLMVINSDWSSLGCLFSIIA